MSDQLLIDLFSAYFSARKNKRNTLSALEFEINYEKEIIKLHQELKNNSYQISKSFAFVVFDPVQREIIASSFRDRVIHHLIFNYINPLFEPLFIHDSYSCRKNKGTSYGIKRVEHFLKACSNNYQNNCYVLKLDLSGYFMSINLDILYYKIKEKILKNKNKCNFDIELILDLIKKIVFHDYTKKCCIKGNINDWRGLPKNKSLFYARRKHGLPIGNLTSQLFSNIYLNEFDHFVKRKLKFKYYGRYVDDFIVIHKDKEFLKDAVKIIKKYLEENLNLKINTKKIYLQKYYKGFKFLGVIIKPFRVYINNRTKNNFYLKIREINNMVKNDEVSIKKDMILSSLNSYLGIMKHHNTYNLRKKTLTTKLHPNLFYFFEMDKNRKDCYLKLVKKY
jgi:retron-type reverse transcriptase